MPEAHGDRPETRPFDLPEAEQVHRGLEQVRRRLLDLTNRNKLISFRHGKSSLRIVDVELDSIYQSLIDEKRLPFVHVPEPTEQILVESDEKPSAKDYADALGWTTAFELAKGRGQTICLPVLHYQEDFEVLIRKINTTARTATEETGANLLNLVFGFLEWRESDDSTQIRQAPLLAVPVSLVTPKAQEQDRSVRLQYIGEDLTTNLSLVEKMRRDFGLEIPYIEEDQTPDQYFQRFSSILEQKRHWRISRQVSLTLLSFGKLLMYLDLDSARWPANAPILRHGRIVDMFSGSQAAELTFATEFDIDKEAQAGEIPPLVCDADSSQHSALIDAARGKNLVIEGPPGTGKSQTITNLIATSIANNKRVLFVAEKMAALEVVKRRLDSYGLGAFCLELHSHKTSKVGLLKSLDDRIQASSRFSAPTTLAHKQVQLNSKRDELTKYASLLNLPYGQAEKNPFELIWKRDSLWDAVPSVLHQISSAAFPEAAKWDSQAIQERKDMVLTYAAHLRRFAEAGGKIAKKENPWSWLPDVDLSQTDQDRLLTALAELERLCAQRVSIIDLLAQTFSHNSVDVSDWLATVERWFNLQTSRLNIPVNTNDWLDGADQWTTETTNEPDDCPYELLETLFDPNAHTTAEHFLSSIGEFKRLVSTIPTGSSLLDSSIPSEFLKQDKDLCNLGLYEYSIGSLQALTKATSDCEKQVLKAKTAITELSDALGVQALFTIRCVNDLISVRQLLTSAPLHLAHLRSPEFGKDGLRRILEIGQEESATLSTERKSLSDHFIVDSDCSAVEMNQAAAIIDSTPWYGRLAAVIPNSIPGLGKLGAGYRDAMSVYRSHCRTPDKRTRNQRASCLRVLAHSRAKIDSFSSRAEYHSQLGTHFAGLDTAWDDLIVSVQWHEEVFSLLPEHQRFASEVRAALLALPVTRLRGILGTTSENLRLHDELENAINQLKELHALVPSLSFEGVDAEAEIFLAAVRTVVFCSNSLLETLKPIELKESASRAQILELFDLVARTRDLRDLIETNQSARTVLGLQFKGVSTNPAPISQVLVIVKKIAASNFPPEIKSWLLTRRYSERMRWLRDWINYFAENGKALEGAERNVVAALGVEIQFAKRNSVSRLREAIEAMQACLEARALLPISVDTQRSAKRLRTAGLDYLVTLCLSGSISYDDLPSAFDYLFCDTILRHLFSENPDLWRLSGVTHEETRSQFASLDLSVIELNQMDIAYRASRRNIPTGVRGAVVKDTTELALVSHEITKQRAHIPIRQLMLRAGRAIQGLKPCFMMSPMSVAQFLAPGHLEFDLVIMDEASQLRPEDALGAIARGAQLVIVGDPKQLPPTTYFQRTLDDEIEESDEKSPIEETESILDIAMSRYQPVRRLRWHYRSQHHSLIAFSNSEFYDDNLIVFPSAYHEHPDLGVRYVDCNGVYENRRNALEAERIVDAIVQHIMLHPSESLGVVTMNFEQRELVEELLDIKLKHDSFSNAWIESKENTPEPFFIKNLENVQGDERDVIFISVTYGPDIQGNHFQRFSGVNTRSGHRRLNVLITRARKRTVLFSSLDPDMINSRPDTPWGVRALKGYMHFAKSGISAKVQISPGAEPSNEHEAAVGSLLKAKGYDVVPQVGVSGYFIDLAVRHPRKPGAFLLGIEFDGKSYHSGRSARDRDRLRQMTLVNQGWKIHRIWSTDWFKNRNSEIERLLHRVRTLEAEV